MKDVLTAEQVEREIERLNNSEAVQIARREQRLKYKRRQYMYQLRWLEKHGKELMESGVTSEALERMENEMEDYEE